MGTESWVRASRRVWGWSVYLETPEPVECAALRQAAEAVIAGESVFAIARRWNQNPKLHTVQGGPWHGFVIANILRRRTNTQGPNPLLSHEVYDAVVAALDVPRPVRTSTRPAPGQKRLPAQPYARVGQGMWVCTAVVRCGVCGAPTVGRGMTPGGRMRLACRRHNSHERRQRDGVRHPTVVRAEAEEAIIAATLTATGMPRAEFDTLSLLQRRAAVNAVLTATITPVPGKHIGVLNIEVKP